MIVKETSCLFFFFCSLYLVHEAERIRQLVGFPGFPLRADGQSAVQCLVLAKLATKLAVCVAKQLAVRRLLSCKITDRKNGD